MAAQLFTIQLGSPRTRRFFLTLSLINLFLTGTTASFITLWARKDELSPGLRTFTRHVLVQGHLATENVVAAWYSSMLMLLIAVAALVAFAADRRRGSGALGYGWVLFAAVFGVLSLDEIGSFHERVGMLTPALTAGKSLGWAYLLAVPIAAVGLFMLAFGWFHVRRVPATFRLIAAGAGMFMLNPVLEAIEMSLIHGAGATAGTWQRALHDLLLVLEEGGLELFGILCFLAAVVTYVRATAGELSTWSIEGGRTVWVIRGGVVFAVAGALVANWLVEWLPKGDNGVPEHWFSAAVLVGVALAAATTAAERESPARTGMLLGVAIALSAFFGAGLHAYSTWHSFDDWRVMLNATLAVFFGMALRECCATVPRILTMGSALLMAAATNLPGEAAPFVAIAGAAFALEALFARSRLRVDARAGATVRTVTPPASAIS